MRSIIQYIIIAAGIVALSYGIFLMSETTTMILPSWFVIVFVALITIGASFGIGVLVKYLLRSKWFTVTFASVIMIFLVGIYAIMEYKPTLKIIIGDVQVNEIKLFVSSKTVEDPEIIVSKYGVGYIDKKSFDNGFYPRIIKNDVDITGEIKVYRKGTFLPPMSQYSFSYMQFDLPGQPSRQDQPDASVVSLFKTGAIDTTRLPKK